MAADKPKSVLIGFSVCPLCAGKTHVKRIDAPGKRAYSHCLDEHDMGCSHTHYATNAQQEELMVGGMRRLGGASATPIAAPAVPTVEPVLEAAPTPTPTPVETKPSAPPLPKAAPVRHGLFGLRS